MKKTNLFLVAAVLFAALFCSCGDKDPYANTGKLVLENHYGETLHIYQGYTYNRKDFFDWTNKIVLKNGKSKAFKIDLKNHSDDIVYVEFYDVNDKFIIGWYKGAVNIDYSKDTYIYSVITKDKNGDLDAGWESTSRSNTDWDRLNNLGALTLKNTSGMKLGILITNYDSTKTGDDRWIGGSSNFVWINDGDYYTFPVNYNVSDRNNVYANAQIYYHRDLDENGNWDFAMGWNVTSMNNFDSRSQIYGEIVRDSSDPRYDFAIENVTIKER